MQTTLLYILGYASICIVAMALLELAHRREAALARKQYEDSLGRLLLQIATLQEANAELEETLIMAREAITSHENGAVVPSRGASYER